MNFSDKIIAWYMMHQRNLPWRKTSDPFTIWLSEIIFQQTRIDQGINYFRRIIQAYPTVGHLALANKTDVLKLWQGLGYYSRALNLLKTAQIIHTQFNDEFPNDRDEMLQLPGIGPYTAAAILSLAFNQAYPVVDGNVIRLFSRYFGIGLPMDKAIGKKTIERLAFEHIDKSRPGDFNQAIMEFGALHCKPQNPDCDSCIFVHDCKANNLGKVSQWPIKAGRTLQKKRYLDYFLFIAQVDNQKIVFVNHRQKNDIWKGLYDFPHLNGDKKLTSGRLTSLLLNKFKFNHSKPTCIEKNIKHVLSHQILFASFYLIDISTNHAETRDELIRQGYSPMPLRKLHELPIPRLIEKFLEKNGLKI